VHLSPGENILHIEAECGNWYMIELFLEPLGPKDRMKCLKVQCEVNQQTPFHIAVKRGDSASIRTILDAFRLHPKALEELMSIRNKQNMTPLLLAAQFAPLEFVPRMMQMAAKEEQLKVMTSIDRVRELDRAVKDQLCSFYGVGEHSVLRQSLDETPSTAAKHPHIKQLIDWSEKQSGFYYLPVQPTVVIFYNEEDRKEGAAEEAEALKAAFTELGINPIVVKDFTSEDILGIEGHIRKAQDTKPLSCLFIIIMAHGKKGVVFEVDKRKRPENRSINVTDSDDGSIEINDILRQMASCGLDGVPKVLVLQCCQGRIKGELGAVAIATNSQNSADHFKHADAYEPAEGEPPIDPKPCPAGSPANNPPPTSRTFELLYHDTVVLISTVSGNISERNHFIPALADQLKKSGEDDDIHSVFTNANKEMQKWIPSQIPEFRSTLTKTLALKHVFHKAEAGQPCNIL